MDVATIISGIGAGVTYALTGWGKKEGQKFDYVKFGTTVIIGGISGLVFSLTNMPLDATMTYLTNLGIVPVTENLLKIIWRKILGK